MPLVGNESVTHRGRRFREAPVLARATNYKHCATETRIYSVARTVVDCFKYRNKLGLDVAIEALRFARVRKRITNREILHFAKLLRQDRVMAPYLESVT